MSDAERLDHGIDGDAALGLRREPAAVEEILPDGEMRKELRILEHEADAAPIGGDEKPGLGVDQCPPIEHDAAAIGTGKPRDQADGHRLAGARAAEQGDDAGSACEGDVEIEGAALQRHVDADHGVALLGRMSKGGATFMSSEGCSRFDIAWHGGMKLL